MTLPCNKKNVTQYPIQQASNRNFASYAHMISTKVCDDTSGRDDEMSTFMNVFNLVDGDVFMSITSRQLDISITSRQLDMMTVYDEH